MSPRDASPGRRSRLAARVRSVVEAGKKGDRPAPLVEAGLLLLVLLFFSRVHAAAGQGVADVATANAQALQAVERALHLDVTLSANRWLVEHPALIRPAVYYYRLYYVVIVAVLVWVYLRRADVYVRVRRALVAMLLLVLPVFWLLPMAPPRLALPGVVDVIAENDIFGGPMTGHNMYSAMPSMHTAWSLWCAYAVWRGLRTTHPRPAWLPWLFPLGMMAVVLTTGNHYVLDIAGSVTLLLAAIAAASAWGRLAGRRRTRSSTPPAVHRRPDESSLPQG